MAEYIVLSIDDDMSARVLYEIMLKRSGFDFVQAEDADAALAQLEDVTPDLIMSDIQLPGKNGLDLVKELRERPELDRTAIVVLSAFQVEKMTEKAIEVGADRFFQKPLKMEGLADKFIEIIKERRGE